MLELCSSKSPAVIKLFSVTLFLLFLDLDNVCQRIHVFLPEKNDDCPIYCLPLGHATFLSYPEASYESGLANYLVIICLIKS